ncbi:MAG: hypothetical protein ACI8W3_002345 [Myxococcota bacterium]|jgi:hypothetical protein
METMEIESSDAANRKTQVNATQAREAARASEARQMKRTDEVDETNSRRAAAKSDPSKGQSVDTMA